MKKIVTSIIFTAIVLVSLQNVHGGSNKPCDTAIRKNQYHCPRHPQITDSWPDKCPICGKHLTCIQPHIQMEPCLQAHDKAPAINRWRHEIATPVDVFDPDNILAAKKHLHLTKQQIRELRAINEASRQNAEEVLTDEQRYDLVSIGKLTDCPRIVDQIFHRVMEHLQIHESKIPHDGPAVKKDHPDTGKCPSTGVDLSRRSKYSVGDCDGYVPYNSLGYGICNYYPYPAIPYYGRYGYYGLRGYDLYHGTYHYGFGVFDGN